MSTPLQSTEEMKALIAKALERWRSADVPNSVLAGVIMCAIETEVLKAKEEIVSTLARSFKGARELRTLEKTP